MTLWNRCMKYRTEAWLRRKSYPEFCNGKHLLGNPSQCECYHETLRATTIFAVAFSSACLGLIYFSLGRFKLSQYVNFVPTNIMEAFLSCVGYKVFKYALKFCDKSPRQSVPAAVVGVIMYFVKAMHIGNPAITLPALLLAPLGIFYLIAFTAMTGLDDARSNNYMFPKVKNVEFYKIWTDSIGNSGRIDFSAWTATMVDLIIMLIVCTLDCMLKVSSTESKLPVKVEKDYEVQLYGYGNMLTTLCGNTVGYMQLKFNVINYGVMGNVTDRRGGYLYAIFCGICFFFTIEHFNFLPRFFLGTMLFFAGAGFVAENLWGSRRYLDFQEWLQILLIVAVFILTEKLLYAVIVGSVLVGISFIIKYAQVPCIAGRPARGGEILSRQRHSALMEQGIKHIAKCWVQVVKLKGFLFFASADGLLREVLGHLAQEKKDNIPQYARTKFVIFDCEMLDGLDASAVKALLKFQKEVTHDGIRVVWSGISHQRADSFKQKELVQSEADWFEDLGVALLHLDNVITEFLFKMQGKWLEVSPLLAMSNRFAVTQSSFEPWADVFIHPASRLGIPWVYCDRKQIKSFSTLLWYPEAADLTLYIVHSGAVAVFDNIPCVLTSSNKAELRSNIRAAATEWPLPAAIHRHGAIVNRTSLLKVHPKTWGIAVEDGEVLFWTKHAWEHMLFERPRMAFSLLSAAMRQEQQQAEQVVREQAVFSDRRRPHRAPLHQFSHNEVPELGRHLRAITVARVLGSKGFYQSLPPNEVGTLPKLPKTMRRDVEVAFLTFVDKDGLLEWSKVEAALNYIGVFQPMLDDKNGEKLTRELFMALAHQLMMVSLGKEQIDAIHAIFNRFDKDRSGELELSEMTQVFQTEFTSDISEEEVNGIVNVWLDNGTWEVDTIEFEGIMSWFIQSHAPYWTFLCGLMEVTGNEDLSKAANENITKEMMMSRVPGLTDEEADQMIWAADYLTQAKIQEESTGSLALDPAMLAAVVFTVHGAAGELPPVSDSAVKKHRKMQEDTYFQGGVAALSASKIFIDRRSLSTGSITSGVGPLGKDWKSECSGKHHVAEEPEIDIDIDEEDPPPDTFRVKLYLLLEEPNSSPAANMVSTCMGVCILVSVLTLVLEPLISPEDEVNSQLEKDIWFGFELFFTVVFVSEYFLRLFVASALGKQTECDFLKQPTNICDILAIVPFFIEQIVDTNSAHFRLLRVIRLIRLSRMARVAKLSRKSSLFGPVAAVLTVIWGIYLKTRIEK